MADEGSVKKEERAPESPEKKARKGRKNAASVNENEKMEKLRHRGRKKDAESETRDPEETNKENVPSAEVFKTPVVKKKTKEAVISPKTRNKIADGPRVIKGRLKIRESVKKVYKCVNKYTGGIGGNGCNGAIYGELTLFSMQKVVDLMKEYTNLGEESLFLDIGAGLGKPNFHVAQDPGVKVSYGIELEEIRWKLSMHNLSGIIKDLKTDLSVNLRMLFSSGDVTKLKTFSPFTHIYSCDIGFPPDTFVKMAELFNNTESGEYYVSYQPPRLIMDRYGFNVDFITKASVKLTGN